MDINPRLFVEIHPYEGPHSPHPHPVRDGRFDPAFVYKVLGMYNPSETSECYFMLANRQQQIWFIPQRHVLAYKLMDSDEFSLPHPSPPAPAAKANPGRLAGLAATTDGE